MEARVRPSLSLAENGEMTFRPGSEAPGPRVGLLSSHFPYGLEGLNLRWLCWVAKANL
jgi:hypothetical protein